MWYLQDSNFLDKFFLTCRVFWTGIWHHLPQPLPAVDFRYFMFGLNSIHFPCQAKCRIKPGWWRFQICVIFTPKLGKWSNLTTAHFCSKWVGYVNHHLLFQSHGVRSSPVGSTNRRRQRTIPTFRSSFGPMRSLDFVLQLGSRVFFFGSGGGGHVDGSGIRRTHQLIWVLNQK